MTSPNPPVRPPQVSSGGQTNRSTPFDPRKLIAYFTLMLELIVAQIAMALGDIEVLGTHPLAFLTAWGQQLQQQATDAFIQSQYAQAGANYANAQLAVLMGSGLASDVEGGVALKYDFTGPAATDLGTNFVRRGKGPGGGGFGPNGTGVGEWSKAGGLDRSLLDRHVTPLATRYQVGFLVLNQPPQAPYLGGEAYTWIRLRSNAAQNTDVYARIGDNDLQVGCFVADIQIVFETIPFTPEPSNVLHFLAGTDVDDRQFIVKCQGQPIWKEIDTSGLSQVDDTDYLFAGLAATAGSRANQFLIPFTDQTVPGQSQLWSAADRLPTSV